MGIYCVGVFGANSFLGTESRDGVLRYRVSVSLTGVCFFWIEPICVGVGGEFSGGGLLGGVTKAKIPGTVMVAWQGWGFQNLGRQVVSAIQLLRQLALLS